MLCGSTPPARTRKYELDTRRRHEQKSAETVLSTMVNPNLQVLMAGAAAAGGVAGPGALPN